ncbi:dermonecrotic toxin domain-containing protein [Pseudomonas sichuanensis]
MPIETRTTPDYQRAVSLAFADRPTLRQLASQQALQVLAAHLGSIAAAELPDAGPVILDIPYDGAVTGQYRPYDSWFSRPLVDALLDALRQGCKLEAMGLAGGSFYVRVALPYFMRNTAGEPLEFTSVAADGVLAELNQLVSTLPERFRQAQVDYWAAVGFHGVSRDRWLAQVIKSTLLQSLPLQDLDAQQRDCVLGLLKGGAQLPLVFSVEVQLNDGADSVNLLQTQLLVRGEWDEGEQLLWCAPSGVVKGFSGYDAFATALRDELAETQRFTSLAWRRHECTGDVFSVQCSLLLERMLGQVDRWQVSTFDDVASLEHFYSSSSDPAQWFIAGYHAADEASVSTPFGIYRAQAQDKYAFQRGLFELALAQAESQGSSALEGVEDLHSYTQTQLRQQMLQDQPDEANYHANDLLLTLTTARGVPGGAGVGPGDGVVETRSITLTEFAIGNLSGLGDALITKIEHRDGQQIAPWLTVDYLRSLVEGVDIGGRYPTYVAEQLDPALQPERVTRFAREWRCSLLFSALSAKLGGMLSEAGLQAIVDYCAGRVDAQRPRTTLMPLAFQRAEDHPAPDLVMGMFVLHSVEPFSLVLYRPLYGQQALTEFSGFEALMAAVGDDQALRESVLQWLDPQARAVYDHGGFYEPHLGTPIVDASLLPARADPPTLARMPWVVEVDRLMYDANRRLLVELAGRQSVSTRQSRWALLQRGAWLLFDVATLLLRGPIATVAWLAQSVLGVVHDTQAFTEGSEFERSAAVVDALLNLGMALAHVRLPTVDLVGPAPLAKPLPRLALAGTDSALAVMPVQNEASQLADRSSQVLDFSWRGAQGVNVLTSEQRTSLRRLASAVELTGVSPDASGVYQVQGRQCVILAGDTYQIQLQGSAARIVGPQDEHGPWLVREQGNWRIDTALRLAGGGPKSRRELAQKKNQSDFEQLNQRQNGLLAERNTLGGFFEASKERARAKEAELDRLRQLAESITDPSLAAKFDERIASVQGEVASAKALSLDDLKKLVDCTIRLDDVLTSMSEQRFASQMLFAVLPRQRGIIRHELIDYGVGFYNETVMQVNEADLPDVLDGMVAKPESAEELQHYRFARAQLEKVLSWQLDLIEVSEVLDVLIESLQKDGLVLWDAALDARVEKRAVLKFLQDSRKVSGVGLRLRSLLDLGELSLGRGAPVDERELIQALDYLAGDELKSAGAAHEELITADGLPLTTQQQVLSSTLDTYRSTRARLDYLAETSPELLVDAKVAQYKDVLHRLTSQAEQLLAQVVRELELSIPAQPRTRLYAQRPGTLRMARTYDGRSVVGEEVEVSGERVVQQHDVTGQQVLRTFRQDGDTFVEQRPAVEQEQGTEVTVDAGFARGRARAALKQVDGVIRLVRQYAKAEDPFGIRTIIDNHVSQLEEAGKLLKRAGIESEFGSRLADDIERLESVQRDYLISTYTSTSHPSAGSLRFLVEQEQVRITRTVTRKPLEASDFLDVFEIRRVPAPGKAKGAGLWEAHFHYPAADAPVRQFSKGHLKLWAQRTLGREAQLRAATSSGELLAIYRGNLRWADVEGLIPFE